MIFTLNILINLCLIFAIWRLSKRRSFERIVVRVVEDKKTLGKLDQAQIKAAIAEKMADRAFSMASSANLGIVALQKALVAPRLITKPQLINNQLAKKGVDQLFSIDNEIEFMRPLMTDDEIEVYEKMKKEKEKAAMNGFSEKTE